MSILENNPFHELSRQTRFQRTYNFDIELPDIVNISGFDISKYVQDCHFGEYSMQSVESMRYGAFRANYAGVFDTDLVKLMLLCPIPDIVSAYFNLWRQLIATDNGAYGVKNQYAKTMFVNLYDTEGIISARYRLLGCFPVKMTQHDHKYSEEAMTQRNYELSVDRIIQEQ